MQGIVKAVQLYLSTIVQLGKKHFANFFPVWVKRLRTKFSLISRPPATCVLPRRNSVIFGINSKIFGEARVKKAQKRAF